MQPLIKLYIVLFHKNGKGNATYSLVAQKPEYKQIKSPKEYSKN